MARRTTTATSAGDELARLRERAAAERVKARALESRVEAARTKVERAEQDLERAYADDDEGLIENSLRVHREAEIEVEDLEHRLRASQGRVDTAQVIADRFVAAHADDLLAERVAIAKDIAAALSDNVTEALRLHRQLTAERQEIDRLITAGGGEPRFDGPESTHAWEQALAELERVVRQNPKLEPPTPALARPPAGTRP